MSKTKGGITYPYEWAEGEMEELQKTYWATHGKKEPVSDPFVSRQWVDNVPEQDPWSNGRYALSAVVWGLIMLVVFGVGAGP
jgi:hypothetical protein